MCLHVQTSLPSGSQPPSQMQPTPVHAPPPIQVSSVHSTAICCIFGTVTCSLAWLAACTLISLSFTKQTAGLHQIYVVYIRLQTLHSPTYDPHSREVQCLPDPSPHLPRQLPAPPRKPRPSRRLLRARMGSGVRPRCLCQGKSHGLCAVGSVTLAGACTSCPGVRL